MKKTLLMLAFATLFSAPKASAQYRITAESDSIASFTDVDKSTITRFWKTNYAVSVHRDVSGARVSLVNFLEVVKPITSIKIPKPNYTVSYLDLPWQISVSDIQVLGDTLYFCGRYADTSDQGAVLGWIPLPFSNSVGNPFVYKIIPSLYNIDKFVLKRVTSTRVKAAAIGLANSKNILIEIPNICQSGSAIQHVELPDSEWPNDILLYNNSTVVVVGVDSSRICIRKGSISNFLSLVVTIPPSPSVYTRHLYGTAGYNPSEVNLWTYSSQYGSQTLAVAYVHVDSIGQDYARVRFFDVDSLQNFWSTQFKIASKMEPLAVVPNPFQSANMTFLQPFFDNTGTPITHMYEVVYVSFMPSTFGVKTVFPNRYYTSAYKVNDTTTTGQMLATTMLNAGNQWYYQNAGTNLVSSRCYPLTFISPSNISPLPKSQTNKTLVSSQDTPLANRLKLITGHSISLSSSCY